MATVWVFWDGAPRVFSTAQAATDYRDEWDREGEIFEAEINGPRLSLFQDWQLDSERTYRAIGRFMYEFSQLEYALRHAVGDELGIKQEHFVETTSVFDVSVLCTLATTVFERSKTAENSKRLHELVNRFRTLNTHRQRVAHGLWIPEIQGGLVQFTSRSNLKGVSHEQQAEALNKLADDALSLRDEFSKELTGVGIFFQDSDY